MKHTYTRLFAPTTLAFFFFTAYAHAQLSITSMEIHGACNLSCNGWIDMSVSGGALPYTYDWNYDGSENPDNDPQDANGLCPGVYTVTVTDAMGMVQIASATIAQLPGSSGMILTAWSANILCNGGCGSNISLDVDGGAPPFSYDVSSISGANNPPNLNNLCPGTYSITVTDANSCATTTSVIITEPSPLVATTCITNVSCFGSCVGGKIELSVTGGTPQYTYTWSNGSTTQDITNACAGTYTVTITDINGCTQTASATVDQPAAILLSAVVIDGAAGVSNGAIDLSPSGGTVPYTVSWVGPNGFSSTTMDLTNLPGGDYCLTLTDANGCTRSSCYTLQGNGGPGGGGPLLINGVVNNSGCGANCGGTITITTSNGTAPFEYTWMSLPSGPVFNGSGAPGNVTFSSLCPGMYCYTFTDVSGQTASACFTVGQGQSEDLKIQSTNSAFCNFDPDNSSSVCEMVCPNSTVTYFVDPPVVCGVPMNLSSASWTVSGAESFTINPGAPEVVVTWGEAGPGLVEFSANSPQSCFESFHCVTVLEEPVAQFSTDPPSVPNAVMQLCKGQTLTFKNESLNADIYEWQFSDDLSVLSEENPQHTFRTPGNFSITLIARSNCLCADTTVLLVEVLDSEPPILDCVGSVCPGETVTYSTSSNCGAYAWVVSPNGSIVSGGQASDNTITVQWGEGPVGSISLSASGCSGAACPQASVFKISIISDNAEIRGNSFVCPNSEEEYTIDLFDGTEYIWALPTGGNIVRGQGTNNVSVAWTAPVTSTTHWLIVDYYNCYLGCGGVDSIPVKILAPFFLDGPVEMCENATKNYLARNAATNAGVNCNWSVFGPTGALVSTFTGTTLVFTPSAGDGNYRLFAVPASPDQTCSPSAELKVSVVARPPNPVAISGPIIVCPGTSLQYEVSGNPPYEIEWKTENGAPAAQTGNPVTVTWNTNPTHWISAAQISLDGLGCKSDTTKLNIQNAANISISGAASVCEGTVGFYTADFYQNFDYQWELLPASAGSIKQGQGKNNVEIFWQTPGTHQLRVTTCGLSTQFNVTVWANPEPVPNHPAGLCPGVTGLATVAGSYVSYTWERANGTSIGSSPNATIPAGAYTIAVTDDHGCSGTSEFSIDPLPKPNVSVTTADPTGFCNNSLFVTLTALVPDDSNFDYQWTYNGSPVGGNSVTYTSNQYGLYSVTATNEYGCTGSDGPILLFEYCLPNSGGCSICNGNPLCPPNTIQGVPDLTPRCDSFVMVLNDYSGLYVPGTAKWKTGVSGGALIASATGDNPSFVYPNAGKYVVAVEVLLSNGQVCEAIDSLDVEAAAQFSQKMACPGDSTLFTDESTRLPEMTIANWQWDFGEAGNADASNLASPGYPYANPGNYTATLTITTATGCTSSYSENVFVPNLPAPAFAPPLANCAGNATAFVLANNTGIIKTDWDFGDPASGALNQSAANPAYHNFSPAGNYTVKATATNAYGCTASIGNTVNITPNPFSGIIFPPTSTICQGSSLTLTAPIGPGASYVWNDGTNQPTLIVTEEGVYDVTLTNANGCSYSPPAKTVDVNPAPIGTIKFLEINELGQTVGVQYPNAAVCAGDDVTLQIQDNGNYMYAWSGGNGNDGVLIFSEDRGNLLSIGTYVFTVTVTNPTTGCTAVLAPFTVTVNPVPTNFSLSANNVCAGTPSTINYTGPQPPEWQIFWNTGDAGPMLQTEEAGLYFVRVVNEFGCSAQSNTVVIFPGPNISALPSGCHERCNPDTLCLPPLPEIVSWQWFFEGQPIPGATSNQFAATESGTYWAELVDVNGCEATSAPLTVELYNGFGNVLGQVWSDVNDNGVIDPADTLVAGIPVQLLQNGTLIASNLSDANGDFDWLNVLSTNYTVQIDSLLLNALWEIVLFSDTVELMGCGGKVFANLLVDSYTCPTIATSVALTACPGQPALFNGTPILAGQSQDFTFQNLLGCDSVVTVTVSALPTSSSALNASVCPGDFYSYEGVDLAVGQSQDFTFQNFLGCDSVVTVTISALPTSASALNASVCPGDFYFYEGVDLTIGQSQNFTFQNFLGCDSVVTVTVSALPTSASTLDASVCPGDFYSYEGVDLAIGQSQNFNLTNWLGCDSVVTVTVSALLTSSSSLSLGVCPNQTVTYQNTVLSAGEVQDFVLTNLAGCDSLVTVTVFEKPSSSELREVKVCPGEVYIFENHEITAGETRVFNLTNFEGCDSTITISVTAWPSLDFDVEAKTSCPNSATGSLSVLVPVDGYSLDNIDFQTSPVFEPLASGSYTVFVRDEHGCVFEKTADVPASPGLEVALPNAFVIPCDSVQITLAPSISGDTSGLQLLWWNGAQTSSVTLSEASPVWLEATNHCETLRRESEVAWADSEGDTLLVYVPNTFAPLAELTENAMFRPFFGKNLTLLHYRLEVYDRWGNFVYETETPENGWLGSFGPTNTGTDVFVWQLWVRVAFCGREIELYKNGDVTVLR